MPDAANLRRAADALGVSVDELLAEEESASPKHEPPGHLNAEEQRVVDAMRADERVARIIRKIAKEFPAPKVDGASD